MACTSQALSSGWEFRNTTPNSHQSQSTASDSWYPVSNVPSVIHLDLQRAGVISDPFVDFNELNVRWVAEQQWTYRCSFSSPDVAASSSITDLVLEGLDTFATVFLNDQVILVSDNMFVAHRVNVTDKLRPGGQPNELAITFDPARTRGLELVKEHPEHRMIVHQTEIGRGPVRKAQYQWGWDWGPIMLTCGPWKPVLLQTYSARIEEMDVSYSLDQDFSGAKVSVKIKTQGGSLTDDGLSYEVLIDGQKVGSVRTYAQGQGELELYLKKPKLWWPAGYGGQDRYAIEVRLLADDGAVLDQQLQKIGLRRAELVQEKDEAGQSFYFRVNGVDIFCGGACWIPSDNFLTRTTPAQYRDWIVRHVSAGNQAMIRVWGGGIYESTDFFDACDEVGVLVWQDFCFACANYPAYPDFLKSVELEARQNVRRLRRHPSLVIWAGNNEDYQIVERYGLKYDFVGDKDPQSWLKTDFPARYIYEYLLPLVVAEEYGNTPVVYHPSSPWGNGTSTTLVVDPTVGDVHQWNVWHGTMRPYQNLPEMGGRFVSEFGMEAYPHTPTLEAAITNPTQRHPGSMAMDFRNKAGAHVRRLLAYVGDNFDLHGYGATLDGFAHLTQLAQADAMRAAYKGWRRRWGRPDHRACGGVLVWQLNDCWPTVSWAVVDYHGVPKPSWYAIRDALRPVDVGVARRFFDCTSRPADATWQRETGHVDPRLAWGDTANPEKSLSDLWIVNGTTKDLVGELTVDFVSIRTGGLLKTLYETPLKVAVEANSTTEIDVAQEVQTAEKENFDPANEDPFIIHGKLEVRDESGDIVHTAEDVSWPDPIKWLAFEDRGLQVVSTGNDTLKITAKRPVKGFVIQERQGLMVDKNGFDVIPGHAVTVTVSGCASLRDLKWVYFGQVSVEDDWQSVT